MRSIEAYSYGCVMAVFPEPLAEKVRGFAALIPDEDLYDDGSGDYGREDEVHVTVKYGLHTDSADEVRKVLEKNPPCKLTLGRMSVFHNDDYVVLKLDVNSPDLHELNKQISENLECTDSFPVYHPHATIAYLKHRPDDKYWYRKLFSDMFDGEEAEMDKLLFSTADDKDYWVDLTGAATKAASHVAMAEMVSRRFMHAHSRIALRVGETVENGTVRIQRFNHSVRVWDLTNAGKRGKKVDYFWAANFDYLPDNHSEFNVGRMMKNLGNTKNYKDATGLLTRFSDFVNEQMGRDVIEYDESQKRGVDVTPQGFKPVDIVGKHVIVNSDYNSFSVADRDDQNNLPTCIPAINGGKKDIKVFYRWAQDNMSAIKSMTFSEVMQAMRKNGIRYHYYCAMD